VLPLPIPLPQLKLITVYLIFADMSRKPVEIKIKYHKQKNTIKDLK